MPLTWITRLTHIPIIWTRPHDYVPAAVDETGTLWIDPLMSETEQRCALAHEAVHLEQDHVGCQPPAVEQRVRAETARRLVPIDALVAAAMWARHHDELAAELGVTRFVLEDRLAHLAIDEQKLLDQIEPPHP